MFNPFKSKKHPYTMMLILLSMVLSSPLFAAVTCVNKAQFLPVFNTASTQINQIYKSTVTPQSSKQKILLKNGVTVAYEASECAKVQYSFILTGLNLKNIATLPLRLKIVLAMIPLNTEVYSKRFIDAIEETLLEKVEIERGDNELTCDPRRSCNLKIGKEMVTLFYQEH